MNHAQRHETILKDDVTFGLGDMRLLHAPGTFQITPASRISIQAIGQHRALLHGVGMDWGCGGGCLTIAAALIHEVAEVVGLDILAANLAIALENVQRNGVGDKVRLVWADSYMPVSDGDGHYFEAVKGRVDFLLANPPSSENDDGFDYRRIVLRGARDFLVDGGIVFLSISYQYGMARIKRLSQDVPGFFHERILSSTDWVSFDLERPDLLHCLRLYTQEEVRGGLAYDFAHPQHHNERMDARTALDHFNKTGQSPLSKWQTHLFRYQAP